MKYFHSWLLKIFLFLFFVSLTYLILKNHADNIDLHIEFKSENPGVLNILNDSGSGFVEQQAIRAPFRPKVKNSISLRIPGNSLVGLRIAFENSGGQIEFHSLWLQTSEVRSIEPKKISKFNDLTLNTTAAEGSTLLVEKTSVQPYIEYKLDPPFVVHYDKKELVLHSLFWGTFYYLIALLGSFLIGRIICSEKFQIQILKLQALPRWTVVVASFVLTVVSSYPVILFNQSFVSPHNGPAAMYYCEPPIVPFHTNLEVEDTRGSDIGAMMWQNAPYAKLQHDSLLVYHELPLWNRFSSGGISLIGQGISQLGDLLHFIPILGNAHPMAWDAKFLLAKFLFILGIGMVSLLATEHLGASLLASLAASFVGYFAWRFNHPAFFAFCYSPWILYFWFVLGRNVSSYLIHVPLLAMTSISLINSGTAKEAYMFALITHLCGLTYFLLGSTRYSYDRFLALGFLGFLVIFSHLPFLYFFIETLQQSFTFSNIPAVGPYDFHLIWSLFDLSIQTQISSSYFMPTTNVISFVGLFLFLALIRVSTFFMRETAVIFGGALISFFLAFDIFPSELLLRVPILNQIGHTGNTFSAIFCVFALLLGAMGFRNWIAREFTKLNYFWFLLLGGIALFLFYSHYLSQIKIGIPKGLILFFLLLAIILLPLYLKGNPFKKSPFQILLLLVIFVITVLKTGQHLKTGLDGIDTEIPNPQRRIDYRIQSPVVATLYNRSLQRAMGVGCNFFAGYNVLANTLSINSPDPLIPTYFRDYIDRSIHFSEWLWRVHVDETQFERNRNYFNFLNVAYLVNPGPNPFEFARDLKKNDESWPLAFSTGRIFSYDSIDDFVELVRVHGAKPFLAIQNGDLAEHPYWNQIAREDSKVVAATNFKFTNNKTSFDISVENPAIVALHENFYKDDFIVTVNGRPHDYFRINHTFKGLYLDKPGHYQIEYEYWPRWTALAFGMLLAFCFSILLSFVVFFFRQRSTSAKQRSD